VLFFETVDWSGAMSDGPLGNNLAYYAAFQITGNLDGECLKRVIKEIKAILEGECNGEKVNGKILKSARIRASNSEGEGKKASVPVINISIE
jgi:hypothetical protein